MKLFERTEQEIFNDVVAHARKQRRRSANKNGQCAYRSEDGLKCFIGALISDDDYDPKFEFWSVRFLPEISAGKADIKKANLANELQILHDSLPPKNGKQVLKI